MHVLKAGDTTLAMKIMGVGLFKLRVAYNEGFARYSPGTLLEVEAVDAFHAVEWSWAVSNTQHPSSPLFRVWPDRVRTADIQADALGAVQRFLQAIAPA